MNVGGWSTALKSLKSSPLSILLSVSYKLAYYEIHCASATKSQVLGGHLRKRLPLNSLSSGMLSLRKQRRLATCVRLPHGLSLSSIWGFSQAKRTVPFLSLTCCHRSLYSICTV